MTVGGFEPILGQEGLLTAYLPNADLRTGNPVEVDLLATTLIPIKAVGLLSELLPGWVTTAGF